MAAALASSLLLAVSWLLLAGTARAEDSEFTPGEVLQSAPAGQQQGPPEEQTAPPEPEEVEPEETESDPEESPKHRDRICQLCRDELFSVEIAVPIWVPLVSIDGEGDDGDDIQIIDPNIGVSFAFTGQLDFDIGPVVLGASVMGGGLGSRPVLSLDDRSVPLGTLSLWTIVGSGRVAWDIPPFELADESPALLGLRPYLGGRFIYVHGTAATASERLVLEGDTVWASPFVGLGVILDPPNGFYFDLSGDAGGFGLGTDLMVSASLTASYYFARWFSIRVGYRMLYQLAAREQRLVDRIEFLLHGPTLALVFTI